MEKPAMQKKWKKSRRSDTFVMLSMSPTSPQQAEGHASILLGASTETGHSIFASNGAAWERSRTLIRPSFKAQQDQQREFSASFSATAAKPLLTDNAWPYPLLLIGESITRPRQKSREIERHVQINHIPELHTPFHVERIHGAILPRRLASHHRRPEMIISLCRLVV